MVVVVVVVVGHAGRALMPTVRVRCANLVYLSGYTYLSRDNPATPQARAYANAQTTRKGANNAQLKVVYGV